MTHAVHLSTWHPVIDGVSGTFVLEQCAALQAKGMEIGLVFSRIQGIRNLPAHRFHYGFPGFIRLAVPVRSVGFKSLNIPGMARRVPALNELILRNRYRAYERAYGRPDILHAHVALETGPAARRIAIEAGLDYIITEHSAEILNGNLPPNRKETARTVYADARTVIAVSDVLARKILDICPTANVAVIANLVRDPVFALRKVRSRVDKRVVIATIGNLVPHKRVDHAIEALMGLPRDLKECVEHIIVGDGPERSNLEALTRKGDVQTTFLGSLSHDAAMITLADADLLLHASAYETFGVVLAEAMALGIPVVATRCGGPESIVTEATGKLVPVDDVAALRAALEDTLSSITEWRARSGEISARAYQLYHETNIAAAISEVYE